MMQWSSVEAVCRCPHRIEDWHTFISIHDNVSIDEAKETIRDDIKSHTKNNDYCNEETVTVKIYSEKEIDMGIKK